MDSQHVGTLLYRFAIFLNLIFNPSMRKFDKLLFRKYDFPPLFETFKFSNQPIIYSVKYAIGAPYADSWNEITLTTRYNWVTTLQFFQSVCNEYFIRDESEIATAKKNPTRHESELITIHSRTRVHVFLPDATNSPVNYLTICVRSDLPSRYKWNVHA